MIYSKSKKYSSAKLRDKLVLCDGRRNIAVDISTTNPVPRRLGVQAPSSAPVMDYKIGAGGLVPGVNYSYAYTHYDSAHDSESPPSPVTDYEESQPGLYSTILQFGENGQVDSTVIYVNGDFSREPDFYNGQTFAAHITNNEFLSVYTEWQYRIITDYEWDDEKSAGRFTINRQFFNVDPDVEQQQYECKIAEMSIEEGVVGGQIKDKYKMVLDGSASFDDRNLRMVIITGGIGKGQRRWIVRTDTMEIDGETRTVITVDKPWKPAPKYVKVDFEITEKDEEAANKGKGKGTKVIRAKKAKDIYADREKAEKKGVGRNQKKYYDKLFSSEYVIIDPLENNGLVRRGNVRFYTPPNAPEKPSKKNTRRITIFPNDRSDLIVGDVISYKDKVNEDDVVTIDQTFDASEATDSTEVINSLVGKRFRIFDGPGAGIDARIKSSKLNGITAKQEIVIDTYGLQMEKKKSKGALNSRYVIYTPTTISYIDGQTGAHALLPAAKTNPEEVWEDIETNGLIEQKSIVIAMKKTVPTTPTVPDSEIDMLDHYNAELANVNKYNLGKCTIMFTVAKDGANPPTYTINRRVISCVSGIAIGSYTCIIVTVDEAFPWYSTADGNDPPPNSTSETYDDDFHKYMTPDPGTEYQIYESMLSDGYYVGWKIVFTRDDEVKKKPKLLSSRVIAYFDETGEIILENNIPEIYKDNPDKSPYEFTMYSEYTRTIGSRLMTYREDGVKKKSGKYTTYASAYNTRFFRLDYFASDTDQAYQFWNVNITYGLTKQKAGGSQAKAKNKRQMKCFNYLGVNKRVDVTNGSTDMNIYPAPNGDEFVWLYDPSSSIYTIFDEAYLANENDSAFGQEQMSCTLTALSTVAASNVDQIRIYRASSSTGKHRFVSQIDISESSFEDTIPESQLGEILDFDLALIAPAKYVTEHKSRLAFAGGSSKNVSLAFMYEGVASCGTETNRPAGSEAALGYDADVILNINTGSAIEQNSIKSVLPNIALRVGDIGSSLTNYIDVPITSRIATSRSVILKFIARYAGTISASNTYEPFIQRYRELVRGSTQKLQCYVTAGTGLSFANVAFSAASGVTPISPLTVDVPNEDGTTGVTTATPYLFLPDWSPDNLQGEIVTLTTYSNTGVESRLTAFISHYSNEHKIAKLGTAADHNVAQTLRYKVQATTTSTPVDYIMPLQVSVNKPVWTVYFDANALAFKVKKSASFTDETVKTIAGADSRKWCGLSCQIVQKTLNTSLITEDAPRETDKLRIGFDGSPFQLRYIALYTDSDDETTPAYCEYHAGAVSLEYSEWANTPGKDRKFATVPDMSSLSVSSKIYCTGVAPVYLLLMPAWYTYDLSGPDLAENGGNIRSALVLESWFSGSDGNYTGINIDGKTAVQVTSVVDPEYVSEEGLLNLDESNGDEITGILSTQKAIAIFKERAIYQYAPEVPLLQLATDDLGSIAPRSICTGRSGFYFITNGRQLHRWDFQNAPQPVGVALSAWMCGNAQNAVAANLCGDHPFDQADFENIETLFDPVQNCLVMIVKQSGELVSNRRLILVYDENKNNWWRLHEETVNNTARSLLSYGGGVAMCTGSGIFKLFGPQKVAQWYYSIHWQDYSNTAKKKMIKRLVFCNLTAPATDAMTTSATATVTFQKDYSASDIPNLQYEDQRTARSFVPTTFSQLVHAGLKALVWKFKLAGTKYLNISSIVVMFRPKEESNPSWSPS